MATSHERLQPMAILTPEAHAARELQRELQEMKEQGIKLDRADRPGGQFLGTNGKLHDAEGRLIDKDGEAQSPPPRAAAAVADIRSTAELDALEEQIAQHRKTLAAQEKARAAFEKEQEEAAAKREKEQAAAAKKANAGR